MFGSHSGAEPVPNGSTASQRPDQSLGSGCEDELERTVLSKQSPDGEQRERVRSALGREVAGEMLGHYRIEEYVAVGGMGAVFRATDVRLDRPVALKILPEEQARDPAIVARFHQEARAAARLEHENIARVFYVGEERGLHLIAFEFVQGVNVRTLIQQHGRLSVAESVNYAIQITGALMHAAARGVVHRDIKPSNIIITPTGRAKLVDMGLARRFERGGEAGLTESGMTLGTFDYISPEQATEPRQADVRSDIYSFGCTLYHMLAGQPPYPTGTALQKLLSHREKPPRNIQELNPDVPDRLAAVINRMLAKNPGDRYQTPDELLGELLAVAADLGLRCTSPEGLIWIAEPQRRPLRWLPVIIWSSAAVLLFALVAALALWPYLGPFQQRTEPEGAPKGAALADRLAGTFPEPGELARPADHPAGRPATDASKATLPQPEPTTIRSAPEAEPAGAPAVPTPSVKPAAQASAGPVGSPAATLVVRDLNELAKAIEGAADGAVIELAVSQASWTVPADQHIGLELSDKSLTVRARPGSRPRLRLCGEPGAAQPADRILVRLSNASLTLEGVDVELAANGTQGTLTAFQLSHASLVLRDCRLLQTGLAAGAENRTGAAGSATIVLLGPSELVPMAGAASAAGSNLTVTSCLFAGGDRAIVMLPGSTVRVSDSIFLPYRVTFPATGPGSLAAKPIHLQLDHVTLFGSRWPMFDIDGHNVQVELGAVVFSWQTQSPGTLAAAGEAGSLRWREVGPVLYHRVATFLAVASGGEQVPVSVSFESWRQRSKLDPNSQLTTAMPFRMPLAEAAVAGPAELRWIEALRVRDELVSGGEPQAGARLLAGFGPLYGPSTGELFGTLAAVLDAGQRRAGQLAELPGNVKGHRAAAGHEGAREAERAEPPAAEETTRGQRQLQTATTAPSTEPTEPASKSREPILPRTQPAATKPMPAASGPQQQLLRLNAADPNAAQRLAEACLQAADGTVIEIVGSGTLREPPIVLGDRRLTLRAAADVDAAIELVADSLRLEGRAPSLFYLRDGSLKLIGLHFRLSPDQAVSTDGWSLVTAGRADLAFENCTAVVANPGGLPVSLVRLTGTANDMSNEVVSESHTASARLSIRNCFVTGPDQLLRMQPACAVRLRIENSLLAVRSALVESVGGFDNEPAGTRSEVVIQHATVRAGQLMRYEAGEPAPWQPHIEVNAADSIFLGLDSAPWLSLASPLNADLLKPLLRWKGMNNSYAGMKVLLQLQGSQMGTIGMDGTKYDWQRWLREMDEVNSEYREAIKFLAPADPTLPLWQYRLHHFRLTDTDPAVGTASDGTSRGANPDSLPQPPRQP